MSNYNWQKAIPGRLVRVGDLMKWNGYREGEVLGGPYMCAKVDKTNVYYGDKDGKPMIPGIGLAPGGTSDDGYYFLAQITQHSGLVHCCPKKTIVIL